MCRSIVKLRRTEPTPREEVAAAARQYVRKVSGFREPSHANVEVFEAAVRDVALATEQLLDALTVHGRPAAGVARDPASP
ncbi:MAG: DUF2277 domain-containing protein [Acidimicrobiia bacterium]|nr:DUF2277 domain-containing protein [Acidimicrobiia bacterium]